jgi:hypothetical protein
MTENTTKAPLTIRVRDYAMREAEKEIAALGLTDPKAVKLRRDPKYELIRDQIGQQIMSGSRKAYVFTNGKPEPVAADAVPRHHLIAHLVAWLGGEQRELLGRGFSSAINHEWIDRLHIEDVDLAADLAEAKAHIAKLEARLADLETGGITVEGREAPELEAAIALYRAVATRPLPDGMTPAKALAERAEKFCKGLSAGAPARIATVCNWQKEPGRKKK